MHRGMYEKPQTMTIEDIMKKIILVIMVAALAVVSVSLYKSYKDLVEESVPVPEGEVSIPYADSTFQNVQEASSLSLEVLPTMASPSTAKNQVWAGAFQLVWNDLTKNLNKAPIEFADSKPQIVQLLNKSPFSEQDLSPQAYYAKWGLVSPALKREIEKGVYDKFHEKSRILNEFKWTRRPDTYVLYAMLKKDQKVGVITAKAGSLTPQHFAGVGTGDVPRAVIGMEGTSFGSLVMDQAQNIDLEKVTGEMRARARQLVSEHPDVGAIVLECTNMPPFAKAVQEETGLPIFDIVTLTRYVFSAVVRTEFRGYL